MAVSLVKATNDPNFDFGRYTDRYVAQLTKLIETKAQGREIKAPEAEEEPRVVNFMQALRESVQRAQQGAAKHAKAARRRRAS